MRMILCPLASGSSGNSTLVSFGGLRLLVDIGISAGRVTKSLHELGLSPLDLSGILITHEHVDHIRGLDVFCRKNSVPLFANEATFNAIRSRFPSLPESLLNRFETGQDFYIDDVNVMPFPIPHDAMDPLGFRFTQNALSCAVATDIGHLNEIWLSAVEGVQALVLESNHDVGMVEAGNYPAHLKRRILSRKGHLCNEDCARAVIRLWKRGTQSVILAHLSGENNLPELAYSTVCGLLNEAGITPGEDIIVTVARRDGISDMVALEDGTVG